MLGQSNGRLAVNPHKMSPRLRRWPLDSPQSNLQAPFWDVRPINSHTERRRVAERRPEQGWFAWLRYSPLTIPRHTRASVAPFYFLFVFFFACNHALCLTTIAAAVSFLLTIPTMSSETSHMALPSSESQTEDWDRSIRELCPGDSSQDTESSQPSPRGDVRTRKLSELLKLHAEKGTDLEMSVEEASAVAEVLGRWVSAPSIHTPQLLIPPDKCGIIAIRRRRQFLLTHTFTR